MPASQLVLAAAPLAAVGGLLLVVTAIDLANRDRVEVAGPKLAWAVALLAVPIGSLAYLWFGRRRRPPDHP